VKSKWNWKGAIFNIRRFIPSNTLVITMTSLFTYMIPVKYTIHIYYILYDRPVDTKKLPLHPQVSRTLPNMQFWVHNDYTCQAASRSVHLAVFVHRHTDHATSVTTGHIPMLWMQSDLKRRFVKSGDLLKAIWSIQRAAVCSEEVTSISIMHQWQSV